MTMRSNTSILIEALRILARNIESGDGVANAAIAEAAQRLADYHAVVLQAMAVRKAQKEYFRTRTKQALEHSKAMERQLDETIAKAEGERLI